MKNLSKLLFLVICISVTYNSFSQEAKTESQSKIVAKSEIKKKQRIKIELERLPNSILVSLRDTYAKHFVTQAYKTNQDQHIYFIELRKGRSLFTVAVDNNGRVLREIRDTKLQDSNALADKN